MDACTRSEKVFGIPTSEVMAAEISGTRLL
jgi:hypothetical protein